MCRQIVGTKFLIRPVPARPRLDMNQPAPRSQPSADPETETLRAELRRMHSMAALGELTGTATHEFNNVLMTIMNYAKMGLRSDDAASREKSLSKILEASQRAAKITNTILAQARNRSDSLEPTRLGRVVEDSLMLLEREMRKYRVAVETELDSSAPEAMASGNQLQRVLLNLLINARQAMPEGGTVLVRVAGCDDGRAVELTVRDNGCGIPAERLPRIFDSFYSTKAGPDESGKGGTGLGLAACKDIVDAHGGRIRVESTPGRGTAFIIRLPAAGQSQAAA